MRRVTSGVVVKVQGAQYRTALIVGFLAEVPNYRHVTALELLALTVLSICTSASDGSGRGSSRYRTSQHLAFGRHPLGEELYSQLT